MKRYFLLLLLFLIVLNIPLTARKRRLRKTELVQKIDMSLIHSDGTALYRNPQYPRMGDEVVIKLRTGKDQISSARLVYKSETDENSFLMYKSSSDENFDYYLATFPSVESNILYYFELEQGDITFYYSRSGADTKSPSSSNRYKIFPDYQVPEWMKGAVLYQIFTDRFHNGNKSNDVVTNEYMYDNYPARAREWDGYPDSTTTYEEGSDRTREFYGGDIDGVIQKLPYLKDLGVDGIYFNPMFVAPSNHKYDAQDYEYIDPHFGVIVEDDDTLINPEDSPAYKSTDFNLSAEINKDAKKYITRTTSKKNLELSNEKLKELVEKADNMGIKIIMDGVFNHCGSFNKWLDREHIYPEDGAYESKDSRYVDYFKFKKDSWPNNESYDSWWGHKTLPKLHFEASEELVNKIMDISRMWIEAGVSGWRLDVAADLGYTSKYNHNFWKQLREAVKGVNPDAVILAEIYGDASSWLKGDEWDTIMNYDAFFEPISFFLTGLQKHSYSYSQNLHNNVTEFDKIMKENMAKMPWQSLEIAMNQLSNHDHSRFLTRTNGMIDPGKDDGVRFPETAGDDINPGIMKEAVVFKMTWMGAPTLYYGDEAGMVGWTDPDNRRTYPWGKEDKEMLNFHKEIIKVHKAYSSISDGSTSTLIIDDANKVYGYARWNADNRVIVLLNNDEMSHNVEVPLKALGIRDGESLIHVFESSVNSHAALSRKLIVKNGMVSINVPSFGTAIAVHQGSLNETVPVVADYPEVLEVKGPSTLNGYDNVIQIKFNNMINKDDLSSFIECDSRVNLNYAITGDYLLIIPKSKLASGDHKFIIKKGLRSYYGNFVMKEDYDFKITVQ